VSRDERAATVRQDQGEMEAAFSMSPSNHLKGLPFERVVWSDYPDAWRETIEVVVGSVS
jgi:hypothetical protein